MSGGRPSTTASESPSRVTAPRPRPATRKGASPGGGGVSRPSRPSRPSSAATTVGVGDGGPSPRRASSTATTKRATPALSSRPSSGAPTTRRAATEPRESPSKSSLPKRRAETAPPEVLDAPVRSQETLLPPPPPPTKKITKKKPQKAPASSAANEKKRGRIAKQIYIDENIDRTYHDLVNKHILKCLDREFGALTEGLRTHAEELRKKVNSSFEGVLMLPIGGSALEAFSDKKGPFGASDLDYTLALADPPENHIQLDASLRGVKYLRDLTTLCGETFSNGFRDIRVNLHNIIADDVGSMASALEDLMQEMNFEIGPGGNMVEQISLAHTAHVTYDWGRCADGVSEPLVRVLDVRRDGMKGLKKGVVGCQVGRIAQKNAAYDGCYPLRESFSTNISFDTEMGGGEVVTSSFMLRRIGLGLLVTKADGATVMVTPNLLDVSIPTAKDTAKGAGINKLKGSAKRHASDGTPLAEGDIVEDPARGWRFTERAHMKMLMVQFQNEHSRMVGRVGRGEASVGGAGKMEKIASRILTLRDSEGMDQETYAEAIRSLSVDAVKYLSGTYGIHTTLVGGGPSRRKGGVPAKAKAAKARPKPAGKNKPAEKPPPSSSLKKKLESIIESLRPDRRAKT